MSFQFGAASEIHLIYQGLKYRSKSYQEDQKHEVIFDVEV